MVKKNRWLFGFIDLLVYLAVTDNEIVEFSVALKPLALLLTKGLLACV